MDIGISLSKRKTLASLFGVEFNFCLVSVERSIWNSGPPDRELMVPLWGLQKLQSIVLSMGCKSFTLEKSLLFHYVAR